MDIKTIFTRAFIKWLIALSILWFFVFNGVLLYVSHLLYGD